MDDSTHDDRRDHDRRTARTRRNDYEQTRANHVEILIEARDLDPGSGSRDLRHVEFVTHQPEPTFVLDIDGRHSGDTRDGMLDGTPSAAIRPLSRQPNGRNIPLPRPHDVLTLPHDGRRAHRLQASTATKTKRLRRPTNVNDPDYGLVDIFETGNWNCNWHLTQSEELLFDSHSHLDMSLTSPPVVVPPVASLR